ncbi:MAG: carboxypeptidase regulatory-like domain-containing protein [Acidobacteria bacterium]|nr:carboxypeptidase regulatory-like domain-containing protein [Acidobacteriota bacterium]
MSACLLRSLALIALLGVPLPLDAQSFAGALRRHDADAPGHLLGAVLDERGAAIVGASVLVVGTTVAATLTDRHGRFSVALPAGRYLIRAVRDGYVPAIRGVIRIGSDGPVERQITLVKEDANDMEAETNQSEIAWRLRHLPRTVLRDVGHGIAEATEHAAAEEEPRRAAVGVSAAGPFDAVRAMLDDGPLTGQLSLFTTTPVWLEGVGVDRMTWPGGSADLTIGAPLGVLGDWQVRGAMSSGTSAFWRVLGEYRAREGRKHGLHVVAAYGSQPAAWAADGALRDMQPPPHTTASIRVSDRWTARPWLELRHAVRIDRDDTLAAPALLSPEVGVRAALFPRTFVSVGAAQTETGPGTGALLPEASGRPWIPSSPPSASAVGWRASLPPQRVRTSRVGLERELTRRGRVSGAVEWFTQSIQDQTGIVFGAATTTTGEYDAVSVGDAQVSGWRARFSSAPHDGLLATIELAVADAQWTAGAVRANSHGLARQGSDRVGDVRTSVRWTAPRTSTFIQFTHRLSRVRPASAGTAALRRQRVALEVQQRAPFQPLPAGIVSFFVDLRTAFHDGDPASLYDEVLIVRNPARMTGGLQVQF